MPRLLSLSSICCIHLIFPYAAFMVDWNPIIERDTVIIRKLFKEHLIFERLEISSQNGYGVVESGTHITAVEEQWNKALGTKFEGRIKLIINDSDW
jgi:hypothetical protein